MFQARPQIGLAPCGFSKSDRESRPISLAAFGRRETGHQTLKAVRSDPRPRTDRRTVPGSTGIGGSAVGSYRVGRDVRSRVEPFVNLSPLYRVSRGNTSARGDLDV